MSIDVFISNYRLFLWITCILIFMPWLDYMIKIMLGSIPHQFFIIYLLENEQELSLGMLIRSVVSIIFYCFMPIFDNFHILLATFYIIFGTNILIKCPVPVSVCCMFLVSQNIHIKRSPNAIKFYGELFWNIYDF